MKGKSSSIYTTIFISELRAITDLFLCLFYPAVFLSVSAKMITTWHHYILGWENTPLRSDAMLLSQVLKNHKVTQTKTLAGKKARSGEVENVDKGNTI